MAAPQYKDPDETPKDAVIKRDETVKPEGRYANMPDEAVPYRRFTKPYYDWFVREDTLQYNGAADQRPDGDPAQLSEIAIGFMSPIENNPESVFGIPELHGAQLAIEASQRAGRVQREALRAEDSQRIGFVGSVFRRTRENAL